MANLIWHAPLRYQSPGDEAAFFRWLHAIPGVLSVTGIGRELHIRIRSTRLSQESIREFLAIYQRYDGHIQELAIFLNSANQGWLSPLVKSTDVARREEHARDF